MVGASKQSCLPDGTWPESAPDCWPAIMLVCIFAGVFSLELIAFGTYYYFIVMRKPAPLQSSTYLPDEHLGSFTTDDIYGVNQADADDGATTRPKRVLLHILFCFCCRVADTWQSVGQMQFFVGVWGPQCGILCLPCFATYVRGQIRQRFQIKGHWTRDLWLWTCCIPCVATQEAKHVDHMCDVAEEEAVVMKAAEDRKKEKERKIREQIAEKAADAGHHGTGAKAVGKGHAHAEKDNKKDDHHHDKQHPDFVMPKSVMDILSDLQAQ